MLTLLIGTLALAQTASPREEPSGLGSRIDALVAPYVEIRDFSGVILVAEAGEVLHERAYGYASFELGVESSPRHRYLIGSISKQFTAAALLLLEQDEVLSLTEPIARWLPGFRRGDEVTLHQLLTHTAGVRDADTWADYGEVKHGDLTLAQIVERIAQQELAFEPGRGYAYSNAGYCVAARVLELASGTGYAHFLQERIFEPAGMLDAGALRDRRSVPRLATGYDPVGRTDLRPASQVSPGLFTGPGSIYATARDLLRWDEALHTDLVLSEASRAKLMRNHGNGYGYGVSVYSRFGGRVVEHDGRLPGYAADLARYTDREAVVVILGNIQSVVRDRFRDDIAALLHGREPAERELRSVADTRDADVLRDLAALAGTYEFGPDFVVNVSVGEAGLLLQANQGEVSEFHPSGDEGLFSRTLYTACRFERGGEDGPTVLVYESGGGTFRGQRRR